MPLPRAPLDPYCRLGGKGIRITKQDSDSKLRALSRYADGLGMHVWRYKDGKIALTSPRFAKLFGSDAAPLVFGGAEDTVGKAAAQAFSTLRELGKNEQIKAELTGAMADATRTSRLTPTEPALPWDQVPGVAGNIGRSYLETAPSSAEIQARYTTGRRWLGGSKYILPVREALRRNGKISGELADLFQATNQLDDRLKGEIGTTRLQAWNVLRRAGIDPSSDVYQMFVEKGVVPAGVDRSVLERVFAINNPLDNSMYEATRSAGGDVKPKITPSEQVPTGNYFPHRFDMVPLRDPQIFDSLVQETMDQAARGDPARGLPGVALTREEAFSLLEQRGFHTSDEILSRRIQTASSRTGSPLTLEQARQILEKYVKANAERVAGNLERSRLGIEGYITDAQRAYQATDARNTRRLAELLTFGKGDARVHQLLDGIQAESGPTALQFARDAYALETGRDRVHLSPWKQELYNIQSARLSMSVIPNLGQPLNNVLQQGAGVFVRAAAARMREGVLRGGAATERSGAIGLELFETPSTQKIAAGILSDMRNDGLAPIASDVLVSPAVARTRQVRSLITDFLLMPFRGVEKYLNRSVAGKVGELYFDDIVRQIDTMGPERGLAHRGAANRLRELQFSPEKIAKAVQAGDRQLLDEARVMAGLRVSDATQFKSDIQSLPLAANQSELGRFFYQFKSFALNQAVFLGKELSLTAARRDPQRWMRSVALVSTVYPVIGIGLTSLRQNLMGPTISSEFVRDRLENADFDSMEGMFNLLAAGAAGIALAGTAGIVSDLALSTAIGNKFGMGGFAAPPAANSIVEAMYTMGAVGRGILNGDEKELARAADSQLAQFGGFGAAAALQIKEAAGLRRRRDRGTPLEALIDLGRRSLR